jgi:hypothetical protein
VPVGIAIGDTFKDFQATAAANQRLSAQSKSLAKMPSRVRPFALFDWQPRKSQ